MGSTIKIDQLSLPRLVQLVDINQLTGGVLIHGDSIGTINFHQGEMVYIGLESSKLRLGERMVEEKFLTAEQLRAMLLIQQRTKPWKPLGTLCLENQLLNPLSLKLAVHRHMVILLQEILKWKRGMFKFERGEVSISDPIALSYFDYLNYHAASVSDKLPLKLNQQPMSQQLIEQEIQTLQTQFLPYQAEFFGDDLSGFDRFLHSLAFAAEIGKNSGALSREWLFAEIAFILRELSAEKYILIHKGNAIYELFGLQESDQPSRDLRLDPGYFHSGKVGSFSVVADFGGEVCPLRITDEPQLAVGIVGTSAQPSANRMESIALNLRHLASALNLALLYH